MELSVNTVKVLAYIIDYIDRKGYPPSLREISRRMKFKTHAGASYHIRKLIRTGYVKRETNCSRGLRLVDVHRAICMINRRL